MSSVNVVVQTTVQLFPAGTVSGNLSYDIKQGDTVVAHQESADLSVTFDIAAPGDYVAVVQRMDAGGNKIGSTASASFTIAAPDVSIDVPAAVTVTVA